MRDIIKNHLLSILPAKRKTSPGGWISFNAPCCVHNGETPDTRGRGGVIVDGDNFAYHCFNCKFKTGFRPGNHLGHKFRKLLSWLGDSDAEIQHMVLEALRIKDVYGLVEVPKEEEIKLEFKTMDLPPGALSFEEILTWHELSEKPYPDDFIKVLMYASERLEYFADHEFYWAPSDTTKYKVLKMHRRLIIPCYWGDTLIGYTARAIDKSTPNKYYAQYDNGYVYNLDGQMPDSKFVLGVEGPFDALAIGGVGLLNNEISLIQSAMLDSLDRQVIIVPDQDKAGYRIIDDALEYGYSVSFPQWHDDVEDVAAAVKRYGKLYTLKSILDGTVSSTLKIELMRKKLGQRT